MRVLAALLLCLFCSGAHAQLFYNPPMLLGASSGGTPGINAPTTYGQYNSVAGTSETFTTTQNLVAGNHACVATYAQGISNPVTTGVSDGTNTYLRVVFSASGTHYASIWCVSSAVAVSSGATVTVTSSAGGNGMTFVAFQWSGGQSGSAVDQALTATPTSASPSITTGTLAQANELVVGWINVEGTPAYTKGAGFTQLVQLTNAGTSEILSLEYKIVASTTAVTWNPTLGTSTPNNMNLISYN